METLNNKSAQWDEKEYSWNRIPAFAVFNDIERLDKDFRVKFKRSANSQLVYSSHGTKKPIHDLVIWHQDGDEKEIEFFRANI